MVIIPVLGDQFVNAKRCEELGLAKVIASEARTPKAIRAATREVLAEPSYRQAAEKMRDDMLALPGIEYAVEPLEQLVRQ